MVSGGYGSALTYILNATDDDAARKGDFFWSGVKKLPTPRGGLMCSKVYTKGPGYATHTQKVVVAGGRHAQTHLSLVDIYDVKEDNWRTGNYLVWLNYRDSLHGALQVWRNLFLLFLTSLPGPARVIPNFDLQTILCTPVHYSR